MIAMGAMKVGDLVNCASIMFGETAIGIIVKYLPDVESWPDRVPGAWEVLFEGALDTIFEDEMEIISS